MKRAGRRSFVAADPAVEILNVPITNPGRKFFPEAGVTKAALAAHYVAHMDRLLPHIAARPLTLMRCPTGRHSRTVFDTAPRGLPAHMVGDIAGIGRTVMVETAQDVITLVERGTVEIHAGQSRIDWLDRPDRVVFELDPADDLPCAAIAEAARLLRDELLRRELRSFALGTGGRGVNVLVPLARRSSADEVSAWSAAMAAHLAAMAPRRFTVSKAKASRRGRIFVATACNAPGGRSIAPYSSRMRPGAPMATPLDWADIESTGQIAGSRVGAAPPGEDPWADWATTRQRIARVQCAGLRALPA